MVNPFVDLVLTVALMGAAAWIFWPESGPFWAWRRVVRATDRVLMEDALKHFHDQEYRGQTASFESLAGALEVTGSRAVEILEWIEARGLLRREGLILHLTPEGSQYALRIIRVHRLWERHLAEETGVREVDWHKHAERQEHVLSAEEADALAARMGHPRFDPHGDPIPTAAGDLPPWQGEPLPSLALGEIGQIVHLEDEPSEIFSQLVAEDLHPGMNVQVFEVSPERIRFWANGEEIVLSPVVAASISVVPLPQDSTMDGPFDTLASLDLGEEGEVLRIAPSCRGLQRRRLMDMGLVPGTRIEAEMRSAAGEPTAYRIRGSLVALRKDQARQVQITRPSEAAA